MSFETPFWLYMTPLMLLMCGGLLVYGLQRREALLGRFAADRLLATLTKHASPQRTRFKVACLLLAVAAIGTALARPQYGVEWSERKSRGLDIVFVLDSSKSMLASDIRPTRLDRAKLAIIDLVERLESDRIGLIAFAGQAFLQTPPTLDYSAFRESLDSIDPSILTSGGSDLGSALRETIKAFPTDNNVKVAVLLTDGEDLGGAAVAAANEAKVAGIQVFTVGIGTPEGEYLRITQADGSSEFIRDRSGQPVRSQLDEPTLRQIAQITGGSYSRLSSESLNQLFENVIATLPRSERASEMQEVPIERFQWALALAFLLLVLEVIVRRRRHVRQYAAWMLFAILMVNPSESQAQTASEEDPRAMYNQAYESLVSGDYETANRLYESAITATQDLNLQRDALYNMGHAKYRQGRNLYENGDPQTALESMKQAEQLFASALEMSPEDPSIREDLQLTEAVRKAIEEFLEKQEQQQTQDSEQSDSSDKNEDSEQSSDADEQNADESSENSNDSQNTDEASQENQAGNASGSKQDSPSNPSEESKNPTDPSSGEDSNTPQGGENNDSNQQDESSAQDSSDSSSPDSPQESTQNPLEDLPDGSPESKEPETGGATGASEATDEAGESENPSAAGQISAGSIEGMSQEEAAALLDSLRNQENLLPFIDATRTGRPREIRDW